MAYSGGDGSSGTPYQISSASDLIELSNTSGDWDKFFIQTVDISFNSDEQLVDWDGDGTADWDAEDQLGFSPIGNDGIYFTGNYDGQNHTISNLFINRTGLNYIGFFGYIEGATIQNLGIQNCIITGEQNVGGLAGSAPTATINNCFSTGTLSGNGPIGGLVGYSVLMVVNNSYSSCNVTGWNALGGFVGYLDIDVTFSGAQPTIRNCYSLGDLTIPANHAFSSAGSFCGYIYYSAIIENCFSIGKVNFWQSPVVDYGFVGGEEGVGSTYTNNFFDKDASNQTSGIGATAKTTAQMKTASTFSDAGWDMTGTVWRIDGTQSINSGYPFLAWQNTSGGTALPVELVSFSASVYEQKVTLKWQTATEVNNYGFEIERMNDGMDEWLNVGFVEGHGNSNSPKEYSFVDESELNGTIQYRLKQIDTDGKFEYSEIVEVSIEIQSIALPMDFELFQNYPNPFNPSTTIKFGLSKDSKVTLEVYNIIGEKVTTLINQDMSAGYHNINFSGNELSTGIYIYKITANEFTSTRKFILMK
ncbi:MAG TPA: T9SS type A sorting domain-containing protein [Ignavibacteriaceae bacterium]|nr:T9SS type A sorting domain-containing protein [Ignavibacteriaceae bacterium]